LRPPPPYGLAPGVHRRLGKLGRRATRSYAAALSLTADSAIRVSN
jgi:hypothetical protein